MKKLQITSKLFILPCITLSLFGCGSVKDANEKNFTNAINERLIKDGNVCFFVNQAWLKQTAISSSQPRFLDELTKVGLFSEKVIDQKNNNGQMYITKEFSITEMGKKYIDEKNPIDKIIKLCIGKMSVHKIIKWTEQNFMGFNSTAVSYLYEIKDLPEWANKPELMKFDDLFSGRYPGDLIKGNKSKESYANLTLSNIGWEVTGTLRY